MWKKYFVYFTKMHKNCQSAPTKGVYGPIKPENTPATCLYLFGRVLIQQNKNSQQNPAKTFTCDKPRGEKGSARS